MDEITIDIKAIIEHVDSLQESFAEIAAHSIKSIRHLGYLKDILITDIENDKNVIH